MSVDDVLREVKGKIRAIVPVSIDITDVEFEEVNDDKDNLHHHNHHNKWNYIGL